MNEKAFRVLLQSLRQDARELRADVEELRDLKSQISTLRHRLDRLERLIEILQDRAVFGPTADVDPEPHPQTTGTSEK
jgi:prefoldin subunit 5